MNPDLAAILASWSLDPPISAGLAAAAVLYAIGWRRLASRGRAAILPSAGPWYYYSGLATIALALLSPISALGAIFFFFHMIEHLLLLLVAPPLLWLGAPLLPVLWGLPREARRTVGRLVVNGRPLRRLLRSLTSPAIALTLYLLATAIWHVPSLYDVAEGASVLHAVEHASFLVTALLFWWPVVQTGGGRRRLGYAAAILYLFAPTIECTAIGALLTFANAPVYAYYARMPHLWGISALADQQIGALIMWIPGSLLFFAAMGILFFRWFEEGEQHTNELTFGQSLASGPWSKD